MIQAHTMMSGQKVHSAPSVPMPDDVNPNARASGDSETHGTVDFIKRSELVRKKAVGGVLKWYERRAA